MKIKINNHPIDYPWSTGIWRGSRSWFESLCCSWAGTSDFWHGEACMGFTGQSGTTSGSWGRLDQAYEGEK